MKAFPPTSMNKVKNDRFLAWPWALITLSGMLFAEMFNETKRKTSQTYYYLTEYL